MPSTPRIVEIHIHQKDLPIDGKPYTMSRTVLTALDTTIVRLVSDSGVEGWGEVCPIGPVYQPQHALGARAALQQMAPDLIGFALTGPGALRNLMDDLLMGHAYAKSAIDISAVDLLGKSLGIRACDLLGGAMTDRVPSYYATGIGTPDEIAKIADEKRREGYPRVQIKAGGRAVEEDIAVIRKVWETVGNSVQLIVDPNKGWTTTDLLHASRACFDIPVTFEQPCNTMDETAAVRSQVSHPIYLDECTEDLSAVLRAVGSGVCDGFGLKIGRFGGIWPMMAVRDICASRAMPHNCEDSWGGDIVAAACVHFGASVNPRLLEGVWLAQPYITGHYDSTNGVRIEDGHIRVPEGPGLGVVPDDGVFGDPVASFG